MCQKLRCRQDSTIFVFNVKLCDKHWQELCATDEIRTKKGFIARVAGKLLLFERRQRQ